MTSAAPGGADLPDVRVPPPGPRSRAIAARLAARECPAFDARRAARADASGEDQAPIAYAEARGANVVDADGNVYVDLAAGFGALALGHGDPEVSRAEAEQRSRLELALGDLYATEVKAALLERLAALHPDPGARVMLGLSGADAVTAALKTSALATGRPGVVAFHGAYHGLSHGPLAACGFAPSFRTPFAGQLGVPVTFAPYPANETELDGALAAVRAGLARAEVGAVLVEPLLGRGGCVVPPPAFLPELRRACDAAGALLIADEVWSGLGRSGAMLASVAAGVTPILVCLGKALGGGHPVSACLGSARAMAAWGAHGGTTLHTATFFGAPPGCAAALAVLDALEQRGLCARSRAVGDRFRAELHERTSAPEHRVREVRGQGLMIGVELEGGAGRALAVARSLLARGFLVVTGGPAGDALTLSPPLTIAEALLTSFAEALAVVAREG